MHGDRSCNLRTKNEWENGLALVTTSLLNFKNYEINGRFVTNLEPQFKIKHNKMKEHKKRHTIGKKIELNDSNPNARCVF